MNAKQRFIKQCKEKFYECYKKLDGKDVVLFAAGGRAHMMVLAFKEMGIKANIRAILDNHCKEERYIEKIPVYNAKRIGDFSDSIFTMVGYIMHAAVLFHINLGKQVDTGNQISFGHVVSD